MLRTSCTWKLRAVICSSIDTVGFREKVKETITVLFIQVTAIVWSETCFVIVGYLVWRFFVICATSGCANAHVCFVHVMKISVNATSAVNFRSKSPEKGCCWNSFRPGSLRICNGDLAVFNYFRLEFIPYIIIFAFRWSLFASLYRCLSCPADVVVKRKRTNDRYYTHTERPPKHAQYYLFRI